MLFAEKRRFLRSSMFLTLANQITILRILLIFPFVICLLKTGHPHYGHWIRGGAVLIFVVNRLACHKHCDLLVDGVLCDGGNFCLHLPRNSVY